MNAGEQVMSKDYAGWPGPSNDLVPTSCAVFSGLLACFSYAVLDGRRSHRSRRIQPIARWKFSKYWCMDPAHSLSPARRRLIITCGPD